jgi:hypothetical protein
VIARITRDRQLPAGVVDAAMASLATFGSGITGVNLLSATDRGVYGIFFTAFVLGVVLVNQLIYVPSQVLAIAEDLPLRLHGIRRTIKLALIPSAVAASVALIAAALTRDLTTPAVLAALTITGGILIPISALQDYVRRSLHIAEQSWKAAAVSAVQLLGVASAIGLLLTTDVERAWIPFGSLAFANVVSVSVGLLLVGAHRPSIPPSGMSFRGLIASGKWLVIRAAIPAASAFVAANVLTNLAGPVIFGYAEAARQVAQPITVLSMGLGAVMGPRAIRAGLRTDRIAANRNRRKYALALTAAAGSYVALAGSDWVLNPLSRIIPSAYEVPWLVTATIAANAAVAFALLPKNELLGASREKVLAGLALMASPILLLAAATARSTGAFARPAGIILTASFVTIGAEWWLRRHYSGAPVDDVLPPTVPETYV